MPTGKLNPLDRGWTDEALIALYTDPPQIPYRHSMALMFDEGVNQKAIPILLKGCERLNITTVQKELLTGEKSDYQVLAHARGKACTLVAEDQIFAAVHQRLSNLKLSHAGIIWVRDSDELLLPLIQFIEEMYERSIDKDIPDILHRMYWQV
jgi:hypothetical protein